MFTKITHRVSPEGIRAKEVREGAGAEEGDLVLLVEPLGLLFWWLSLRIWIG